jgi:hypothetical protein
MPLRKIFLFLILILPLAASASAEPAKKYTPGEILVYKIEYLGIPVGESRAEIKAITEYEGRKVYPIEVKVRSYSVIDWIYKVRDEHRSLVDVETLQSLRYEKKIHEGRRRAQETIVYPFGKRIAHYLDAKGETLHEMEAPEGVQDQMSCGYWTRTLDLVPDSSVFIPVNADKKNWNLEVKVREKVSVKTALGTFEAVRFEPLMEFQGIFIRKGQAEGWVSLDFKRIPLKMKVKIPVLGAIHAELVKYEPGREN